MEISIKNSSEIIEKYKNLMLSIVNTFSVFEKDEALDEAREVCIKAIEKYDSSKAGFGGYLKYCLYYHFLDKSKKQIPDSLNDYDNTGAEIQDSLVSDTNIEQEIIDKENYKRLYKALGKLSDKDRKIIQMKFFENKSHKEIGKILGISAKTVTNRNYEAMKKLKSDLSRYIE